MILPLFSLTIERRCAPPKSRSAGSPAETFIRAAYGSFGSAVSASVTALVTEAVVSVVVSAASPQETAVAAGLSVRENLELMCGAHGFAKEKREKKIEELTALLGLQSVMRKKAGKLSGGWQRRLSIAMALISEPKILFLDEPTIGLDPTTKRTLWDLIRELNDNGHTIILCSHDMHEVDMLCDNVGIINTGNLVAYDTPQGLKDALLESNKQEFSDALSAISDENEDSMQVSDDFSNLSLKKMSILLKNQDDNIIEAIDNFDNVESIEIARNGRINLRIDGFDDMAVQNVLNKIISSGGCA